jgi:hypothetical protein
MLASLGIRRVRAISKPGIEWYVEQCWQHNILVRAVVVDGFYCQADEYLVMNEPNLNNVSAADFAKELQIHRQTYPDLTLISGGLGDATEIGIDAADYLKQVKAAGGLNGYNGVAIHYPKTAARMAAFKKAAGSLPIHVDEWNVPPQELPGYITNVLMPYAQTADFFCANAGMQDASWAHNMGLFNTDWMPADATLRYLLSMT